MANKKKKKKKKRNNNTTAGKSNGLKQKVLDWYRNGDYGQIVKTLEPLSEGEMNHELLLVLADS